MNRFPYIPDYINNKFRVEKQRLDYIFLRPPLLILYFILRVIIFPLKYIFHRKPIGFEGRLIDTALAFGFKYFASHDAVELIVRHIQLEPILYRYLLIGHPDIKPPEKQLNGIHGKYDLNDISDLVRNNVTIAHDELSYELVDRFDKEIFLQNLEEIRASRPINHMNLGKEVIDVNRKHSLQWFGCTTVVMFIVFVITLFADLRTTVKALNSFGSDSILLWAMKHIYQDHPEVMTDLDFYLQVYSNRSHYNSSAFFSDPSQYLYYHIVFDEFAYDTLINRPAGPMGNRS
ncbi:MAG: hypothetical protein MK080_11405 [Opitutales bacterium]|nr:hypothetical protein [Opitutales bacterium]NRA28234.1 hypothetical protein [Opitutales bacterium]